jgi:cytohesin
LAAAGLAAFEQSKPMKTNWLVGSVFLAGAMVLRAQTNDLSAALRQGLFEEEADRNLDAAISNYQVLATQFDQDRQIAATAIFRLGECYRKLGRDNDAVVQYQRILREFPDQQTLATLSRQNLTALNAPVPPQLMTMTSSLSPPPTGTFQQRLHEILARAGADTNGFAQRLRAIQESSLQAPADATVRTHDLEAETVSLKAQLAHLSGLKGEYRRMAVQQNFPNPVLTTLMQQLNEAEQKLASLTNDYAPQSVPVVKAAALVNTINQQIDAQVDGAVKGLQAKLEADLETVETLRAQSVPVPAANTEASTVTGDEDREIQHIQTMIQNSPDLINWPDGSGHTPLEKAAINGWIKVAAFLLNHGADVNAGKVSALNQAANAGNRAMVEFLLSRGADINVKAWQGKTPLHTAVEEGFQAVTEVLLANKADVNAQDNSGDMPLHLAAQRGQTKIVQMLLAAGADPNAENKMGRTPLSFAAESSSTEAVKMLLAAKADPNGGKLDAPLFSAIYKQDAESAKLLLENGANPNVIGTNDFEVAFNGNFNGNQWSGRYRATPLWLAISTKQLPMVNLLLKFKADPNDSQTDERPLFKALSSPDILGALLNAGGKVDSHLTDGMTLLDYALNMNFLTSTVETLLKHGANPNVCDLHGNTPLHYAVWGSLDRNKIALLLDHQADPNVRNDDGKTPLDIIKARLAEFPASGNRASLSEIASLLRQHGALDNLPHWDRIEVSRSAANYSATVFRKGTNDWNRFTLLETLLNVYPEQFPGSGFRPGFGTSAYWATYLSLPDLTRLTIIRHQPNTTNETRIKVDLLNSTNGIDCFRDVPLEFGDVVEVPEREHALGDRPVGLTDSQRDSIVHCLKGSVRLVVHGSKAKLPVNPYPDGSLIGSVLNRPEAQNILLSSSNLSRVKVTRPDPATGKKHEWILDCSNLNNAPDLWLRDGDVIEVPDK